MYDNIQISGVSRVKKAFIYTINTIIETTGTTSVHFYDISLGGQGQLVGRGLPPVQILIKPIFPIIKGLCLDNVHEPSQQLHILQQEMKVSKYQLRIPDN